MDKENCLKNYIVISLDKLVKADWNYKEEDAELQASLEHNMKLNGQIENIIVRELDTGYFEIANGNHRYEAMKTIGLTEVVAYNLGKVTQSHAKRIATATNETRFKSDQAKLGEIINELILEFGVENLAKDLPFSEDQLTNFSDLKNFDWENPETTSNENIFDPTSKKIVLNLPADVAEGFEAQINRINKLLYPKDPLKNAAPIMAIQIITQIVVEYKDEDILGEG